MDDFEMAEKLLRDDEHCIITKIKDGNISIRRGKTSLLEDKIYQGGKIKNVFIVSNK